MFPPTRLTVEQFIAKHGAQAEMLKSDSIVCDIHRVYELIDSKSSSLLTHVSIMIAACTFLYGSTVTKSATNYFFLLEAFVYMGIGLTLLFCLKLSMYETPDDKAKWQEYYGRSCRKRATVYSFALWLTKVTTVFVLLTMVMVSTALF